jgi:hypothetical protein
LGVQAPELRQAAEELALLVAEMFGGKLGRKVEPALALEESTDVLASVA